MPYQRRFMDEALRLAAQADPFPNPRVGCVIVKAGKVLGRGYHHGFGRPHAEREALADAKRRRRPLRGAEMYVTLEPCDHHGKTPPCTEAIIKAGISKVYVGMKDPHAIVKGKGMKKLQRQGIRVKMDTAVEQARSLNRAYLKNVERGLPYVALKVGASLDGRIATRTGDSKWITNAASRKMVHELRARFQGIVTGINTVIADDPRLTVRSAKGKDPVPIILDSRLRIPLDAKVLKGKRRAVIVTCSDDEKRVFRAAKKADIMVVRCKKGRIDLKDAMARLYAVGFRSLLVEAGGEVTGSFFDERLVDYAYWFIAPKIIGGREAKPAVAGRGAGDLADAIVLADIKQTDFDDDLLMEGRVQYVKKR